MKVSYTTPLTRIFPVWIERNLCQSGNGIPGVGENPDPWEEDN